MRYLGNVTYVKILKKDSITNSGIVLLRSIYPPIGACILGEVVAIGEKQEPVSASYKIGDTVVFQKMAATGAAPEINMLCGADLKILNIDIAAKLVDGTVTPVDDYVLVENFSGHSTLASGLVLPEGIFSEKEKAKVVKVGENVKYLKEGSEVILDLMAGSYMLTDENYKISETHIGIYKSCLIYKERSILAEKV